MLAEAPIISGGSFVEEGLEPLSEILEISFEKFAVSVSSLTFGGAFPALEASTSTKKGRSPLSSVGDDDESVSPEAPRTPGTSIVIAFALKPSLLVVWYSEGDEDDGGVWDII